MDSMKKIVVTEDINNTIEDLTIISASANELSLLTSYVELTRHLKEIYQWYEIINYNLDMIKELYPDGNITALNSHTISLLSAGKNAIDSIELCIANSFKDGDTRKTSFATDYTTKEYDNNFSYRFLSRLRNFTQHGHIPVSHPFGEAPCFDITQIYDTPHYSFNKTLQKEAMQLVADVAEKCNDSLTLSYRDTVCSYSCSLYKIINAFFENIKQALNEKYDGCINAVSLSPEIIHHNNHPEFDGFIFYQIENETELHCFNINDDPRVEHERQTTDSAERHENEQHSLEEFRKTMIPL